MPDSRGFDWLILAFSVLLFCLGALVIFSIDFNLFKSQLVFFAVGLAALAILSFIDYEIFRLFPVPIYLLSIFLLLMTIILGRITRETVRWVKIGSYSLQFSELIKPLLVIAFSSFAMSFDFKKIKDVLLYLGLAFLPSLLVFLQPDLGNALVLMIFCLGILFVRGIKKSLFIPILGMVLILLPLGWQLLKPYQRDRLTAFLSPEHDPLGAGYHLIQARIAIGSGQIFGKGLGSGSQSQLRFLPERHSDFIFACLAEELGLLGASILIIVAFFLVKRIISIGEKSGDMFGRLITIGAGMIIFFQIFVSLGMNLGLVPITGITLPLISYGGSSLVSTMALLGLVESVARGIKKRGAI